MYVVGVAAELDLEAKVGLGFFGLLKERSGFGASDKQKRGLYTGTCMKREQSTKKDWLEIATSKQCL